MNELHEIIVEAVAKAAAQEYRTAVHYSQSRPAAEITWGQGVAVRIALRDLSVDKAQDIWVGSSGPWADQCGLQHDGEEFTEEVNKLADELIALGEELALIELGIDPNDDRLRAMGLNV